MTGAAVLALKNPGVAKEVRDALSGVLREGAPALLAQAIEAEVAEFRDAVSSCSISPPRNGQRFSDPFEEFIRQKPAALPRDLSNVHARHRSMASGKA